MFRLHEWYDDRNNNDDDNDHNNVANDDDSANDNKDFDDYNDDEPSFTVTDIIQVVCQRQINSYNILNGKLKWSQHVDSDKDSVNYTCNNSDVRLR